MYVHFFNQKLHSVLSLMFLLSYWKPKTKLTMVLDGHCSTGSYIHCARVHNVAAVREALGRIGHNPQGTIHANSLVTFHAETGSKNTIKQRILSSTVQSALTQFSPE